MGRKGAMSDFYQTNPTGRFEQHSIYMYELSAWRRSDVKICETNPSLGAAIADSQFQISDCRRRGHRWYRMTQMKNYETKPLVGNWRTTDRSAFTRRGLP
jgi:hypothetical protein